MHRTSCKFLSILLEIFSLLATKGFCTPPELREDAEKSGAMKFEDIEGGGFGEGEGTKDVSGKVETEDQLDDAFKEGQEKKEKDTTSDIKDEKEGIEMSDDFEGKSFNPEKNSEEEDGSGKEEEEENELDKQMGDVDGDDYEKLDDKVWGSDSEDEDEELNDELESGGVTQTDASELVAKDGQHKENKQEKTKTMENAEEMVPESQNDEYQGDVPDPLIDAPADQEPEVVELPDDMEIKDDKENGESDGEGSLELQYDPDETLESGGEMDATDEQEESVKDFVELEDEAMDEDVKNATSDEPAQENADDATENHASNLPTQTPTSEAEALSSADPAKNSSKDPVQEEEMEWEGGAQQPDEQHKEGQGDSNNVLDQGAAHEGKHSSVKQTLQQDQGHKPKLKPPADNRTLDTHSELENVRQHPITDKQSQQKSLGNEDNDDTADVYEHVSKEEDGTAQAVDVATADQAAMRPIQSKSTDEPQEEEEIIELSSDDEDDFYDKENAPRTQGDVSHQQQKQKPGEYGDYEEDVQIDMPEGEVVLTHTVPRGDSTIHSQHQLWSSMSISAGIRKQRLQLEQELDLYSHMANDNPENTINLWQKYEVLVSNLAQELCEQLRLVLEPTKMSKLKGDYRTGKRLNMRKIIPYIASQFRKDKIWLRRTKPSKRQYQIMLAVDDSSSMSDNHSKQLAFESLAVLGQALSFLEAGELAVVSFGEKVELLLGFNEQFNTYSGAKVFQQFSFNQKKTSYVKLLQYAADSMMQARNKSAMISKETAQLLVVVSDGRGIFNEGEQAIQNAVRQARDTNIFMVFIIIDSPLNKDSILDISCPVFENNKVTKKPYLEKFPFPFYIILRDISSLPMVLGEALRQWFELVTSTER